MAAHGPPAGSLRVQYRSRKADADRYRHKLTQTAQLCNNRRAAQQLGSLGFETGNVPLLAIIIGLRLYTTIVYESVHEPRLLGARVLHEVLSAALSAAADGQYAISPRMAFALSALRLNVELVVGAHLGGALAAGLTVTLASRRSPASRSVRVCSRASRSLLAHLFLFVVLHSDVRRARRTGVGSGFLAGQKIHTLCASYVAMMPPLLCARDERAARSALFVPVRIHGMLCLVISSRN